MSEPEQRQRQPYINVYAAFDFFRNFTCCNTNFNNNPADKPPKENQKVENIGDVVQNQLIEHKPK